MYQTLLLLHVLSSIVAFGPQFAAALDSRAATVKSGRALEGPALIAAGLFGILLVAFTGTDRGYDFASSWVSAAFTVWFIQNGVLHGLVVPGRKALEAGDPKALGKVRLGHLLLNLSVVIMLGLMIWKPGS